MKLTKTTVAPFAGSLLLAMVVPAVHASEPLSAPVKLAGTWKLNKDLSDNPGRKMMEAMQDGRGPSQRGGPPGGGRPGGSGPGGGGSGSGGGGMSGSGGQRGGPGGGGRGGPRGGGGFGGDEPPLDGAEGAGADRPRDGSPQTQGGRPGPGDPPDQGDRGPRGPMGIAASPEFVIEQEGDNLAFRTESNLRLLHSDGEKRKKEGSGGRLEVVARFVKGALVIETKPEMGGKRKETYTLQPDGKLQIDFEIEGAGPVANLKFKLVYEPATATQF